MLSEIVGAMGISLKKKFNGRLSLFDIEWGRGGNERNVWEGWNKRLHALERKLRCSKVLQKLGLSLIHKQNHGKIRFLYELWSDFSIFTQISKISVQIHLISLNFILFPPDLIENFPDRFCQLNAPTFNLKAAFKR